jgi:hypothetical protein
VQESVGVLLKTVQILHWDEYDLENVIIDQRVEYSCVYPANG